MGFLNTTLEDDANLATAGTGQNEGTNQLPKPGFWANAPGALEQSIVGGATEGAEAIGDTLTSGQGANPYTGQSSDFAAAPGQSYTALATGNAQPVTPDPNASVFDPDTAKAIEQLRENMNEWTRLDPQQTGAFGMAVGPIAKGLTEAGIGGAVGGPWGAAALMGGASADETYHGLVAQGVDEKTAQEAAAAQGAFSAVGAFLPMKVGGTLLKSIAAGAGINLGFGIADRAVQMEALKANGYDDMAKQQEPFAFQSMLADTILGAAFGGAGHIFHVVPPPEEVDAASAVASEAHFNNSAPGLATTPEVANLHVQTLSDALDAMANDRMPKDVDPATAQTLADGVIMDPARMDFARKTAEAVNSAPEVREMQEAQANEPVTPEHARRASDQLAQFEALRARKNAGETLSPDEQEQLQAGYELDRTTAKIGGGDIRMPGIRNMDAFNEMHAAGQLPSHIGMVDADNFKAINDTMNHSEGDRVIEAIGHTLAKHFGAGNVFHKGGDEFVVTGDDPGAMQTAYHGANEDLGTHQFEMRRADGTGLRYNAPRVSAGFARMGESPKESINEADTALQGEKAAKLARGERHERTGSGGRPADVRGDAAGRPEAGNGAGSEAGADRANGPTEVASATGDPIDDEMLDGLVAKAGNSPVEMPDGTTTTLAQYADKLRADMGQAEAEGRLHDVAVACFLGTGGVE